MVAVYVDVLVCINILITYIFLVCTRVLSNVPSNKWGVCIGAIVGGLSSLTIFLDEMNIFLSVAVKLIVSALIVFFSFIPNRFKVFLKTYFSFFGISMLFGGAIYFIEITFRPHGVIYMNGTVYFDMDIKYLVGCTFLIYGIFLLSDYLFLRRATKNEIYKVSVTFRNTQVELLGYIDTGNNLTDSLTGRNVFVGELKALAPLFTYEECLFFRNMSIDNIPESLVGAIHFVPCKTVCESALLPAFVPCKAGLTLNKKQIKLENICIAVVDKSLSDGEYNLLLNKNITD